VRGRNARIAQASFEADPAGGQDQDQHQRCLPITMPANSGQRPENSDARLG
jgi:hypothetical protein